MGLDEVGVDEAVDDVALELGAIASSASQTDCGDVELDYAVADAQLVIDSPLVGDLVGAVNTTVSDLDDTLSALAGEEGIASELTSNLDITVPGVLSADLSDTSVSVETNLEAVTESLLAEPITRESELLAVDLSSGQILVDVAQLHCGDLSNLDPNTSLLTSAEVERITDELTSLLNETLTAAVEDTIQSAVQETELSITLGLDVTLLEVAEVASGNVELEGSLADFTTEGGEPTVEIGAGLLGIELDGGILSATLESAVVPAVQTVLDPLLGEAGLLGNVGTVLEGTLDPVLSELLGALEPVLDELTGVADVRVNVQPQELDGGEGDLGPESHTIRAVEVDVLDGLVLLPLASSTIRTTVEDEVTDPGVTITPNPVDPGDEIEIIGEGYEPGTEVDVTIEDEDGNVIIDEPGVEVDEDGGFVIEVPIPEDTEPGDYTVIVEDPETGDPISEDDFTVTPPEVVVDTSFRISPEVVEQGSATVGVGGNWTPGSTVTLQIDGVGDPITVTVDENGLFTQTIPVPAETAPGEYVVTATDGDRTESHPLTVEEATGTGPGDEDGTGDEDDDSDPREDQPGPEQPGAPGDGTPGFTTDPNNPFPGEEITIIGEDFDPELENVGVVIEGEDGTRVDLGELPVEDGNINGPVTIPEDTVPGDYTVIIVDPETGEDIAEAPIRVIDPDYGQDDDEDGTGDEDELPVERDPAIAISPDEVEAGDPVAVGGGNWEPGSTVGVTIVDGAGSLISEGASFTADEQRLIQGIITVPEGTEPGSYTVVASDGDQTATAPLTVIESTGTDPDDGDDGEPGDDDGAPGDDDDQVADPSLSAVVSHPEIGRGDVQTVTVTGVEPGTEVHGVSDDEGTVEHDHTAVADENGHAVFEWTIPQESEHREHVFVANAEGYEGAEVIYTVIPNFEIEVMNDVKAVGEEQVGVAGGYTPGVEVQAYMNSYPTIDLGTQIADENGEVTFTWTTPAYTETGWHTFSTHAEDKPDLAVQFYVVAADDGDDDGAGTGPSVSITPDPAEAGEDVVIEGDGHEPGTEVDVTIEDEDGNVIIEQPGVEVDDDGSFQIVVPIPEDTTPGDYTVVVTDPETGDSILERSFAVVPPGEGDTGTDGTEGTGTGPTAPSPSGPGATGTGDGVPGDGAHPAGDGARQGSPGFLALTGTAKAVLIGGIALILLMVGAALYAAARSRREEQLEEQ